MALLVDDNLAMKDWRIPPAASLFWPFTFFAWISFVGLNTLMRGPIVGAFLPTLLVNLGIAFMGIGIALLLEMIIHSAERRISAVLLPIAIVITAACVFAAFDVEVFFALSGLTLMTVDKANYIFAGSLYGFVFSALGLFYFVLNSQLRRSQSRVDRHREVVRASELKALRYQLTPHFLYNTLNATSALILDDQSEQADRTVEYLSRFLRFSLDEGLDDHVTLAKEVEMLKLYLDIEKIRFGNRLNVVFDIEVQAFDCQVPSLVLQPLVENAIKHAIAPYEFGGTIRIGARLMGQALEITVSDSGPLRGLDRTNLARLLDSDRGVGLRNTRERLDHSFGKEASLDFALSDPHGLLVVIKMPAQSGNLSKVDTARAAERSTNGFMRNQAS